jgi:hypothetical protein
MRRMTPRIFEIVVKRFQPTLNIERLDVFRDFVPESRCQVGSHDGFDVTDGVHRFRAHGVRPETGFKGMLRKKME